MKHPLSCRSYFSKCAAMKPPLSCRADDPIRRTAESMLKIINFLLFRVPAKDKRRYLSRVRGKIMRISPGDISGKTMPPTAAIGQAIAITKNVLSGLNPFFVKRVIDELGSLMMTLPPEIATLPHTVNPPIMPRKRPGA